MIDITVTGGTLEQQEIDAYVRHVQEKIPGHALKTLRKWSCAIRMSISPLSASVELPDTWLARWTAGTTPKRRRSGIEFSTAFKETIEKEKQE